MMRRVILQMIVGGIALAGLSGCGDDQFPDYHYKMTIYAGGKAFSSVRAVTQKQGFSAADSSGQAVTRELEGEAVILDLPDGKVVYALLGKPDEAEYAQKVAGYALLHLLLERARLLENSGDVA